MGSLGQDLRYAVRRETPKYFDRGLRDGTRIGRGPFLFNFHGFHIVINQRSENESVDLLGKRWFGVEKPLLRLLKNPYARQRLTQACCLAVLELPGEKSGVYACLRV